MEQHQNAVSPTLSKLFGEALNTGHFRCREEIMEEIHNYSFAPIVGHC